MLQFFPKIKQTTHCKMGLETKVDHLKVIVFDLGKYQVILKTFAVNHFEISDYTLWPFWVDTHVDPPFQKK